MGRVCMVPDVVAELVMGRVCHGPSLLWAEMSRNPDESGFTKRRTNKIRNKVSSAGTYTRASIMDPRTDVMKYYVKPSWSCQTCLFIHSLCTRVGSVCMPLPVQVSLLYI